MSDAPVLVAHADWSTAPRKRWMAVAQREGDTYELSAPEPAGETGSLLSRLQRRAQGGLFVVGFDFPIGVPAAYAERAGIRSFLDELPRFGSGKWSMFYELAHSADDISLRRPFYPFRPGGTSQRALIDGLGVHSMRELLRACERSEGRPNACSLFWTLGGNQVGRAAISGWREVLVPALRQSQMGVAIWPFHGELSLLLCTADCVIVETYPAEAGLHIGLDLPGRGWSKRRRSDRQVQGVRLLEWAAERPEVRISEELAREIRDGFSSDSSGEDRFDAVVGLMSMIDVLQGYRADGAADSSAPLQVEGWIFGQAAGGSGTGAVQAARRAAAEFASSHACDRPNDADCGRVMADKEVASAEHVKRMRDALVALHDEVGKYINDNGMTPMAGSVAEAESRVADRGALHAAYSQGHMLLEAAADHTFALTRLLVEPVQTIAPWTCVRAALEASAICCWLLEHRVDSRERIGRSIALRCEGLIQQRKLARSLHEVETEARVDSRLREVEEAALLLGYQERHGKGGRRIGVGPPMPSTTAVVAQTFDQEATFRILSAMAHGHTWATVRLGFEAPNRNEPTVTGKALSPDSAVALLMTAADSLALPVWSEACLFGHDLGRLTQILERSYTDMGFDETRHFWLDASRDPTSPAE